MTSGSLRKQAGLRDGEESGLESFDLLVAEGWQDAYEASTSWGAPFPWKPSFSWGPT